MALRCIHCNRSEVMVELDSNFQCTDKIDCADMLDKKDRAKFPHSVSIYVDGACYGSNVREGQPGGIGVYTTIDGASAAEWSGQKTIAWGSNMDMEWLSMLYGLSVAILMKRTGTNYIFRLYADNQPVVYCLNGDYKTGIKFKKYHIKADKLRQKLGVSLLGIVWIPRAQNQAADKLSKLALLDHN